LSLNIGGLSELIDIAFPIIHGTFGEDGCIQGFFQIMNIPFTGPDVYSSAACMNKVSTKRILQSAGIPICGFLEAINGVSVPSYGTAKKELGDIMFVKPSNLGSSVGISRCLDETSYKEALDLAFQFDDSVIIEENYPGREIEFAVMGNYDVLVSPPGEVIPENAFYSYKEKYDQDSKTQLKVPTELDKELLDKLTECARKTYAVMQCNGLARIDFMLRSDGEFMVNELNTLPGFTKISMFPALFQAQGYTYPDIITKIVQFGFERYERAQHLRRSL